VAPFDAFDAFDAFALALRLATRRT